MKVKDGTIWKDEIGNVYAVVKHLYDDKCIVIDDRGSGFNLIDYFVLDHVEGVFRAVRLKHYDTLDDALSDNGYTPHNLKVTINYRCKECGELCSRDIWITSADVLKKVLEEPFLFLNDIECTSCHSQNVRVFEVCASDEGTDITINDDVFGI